MLCVLIRSALPKTFKWVLVWYGHISLGRMLLQTSYQYFSCIFTKTCGYSLLGHSTGYTILQKKKKKQKKKISCYPSYLVLYMVIHLSEIIDFIFFILLADSAPSLHNKQLSSCSIPIGEFFDDVTSLCVAHYVVHI